MPNYVVEYTMSVVVKADTEEQAKEKIEELLFPKESEVTVIMTTSWDYEIDTTT